jgi:CRP-like cAMP-binding protein
MPAMRDTPNAALHRLLARVPLFAGLSPAALEAFLNHCAQETVPAGTVLIEQGEHGRHVYVLLSGRLKVSHHDAAGSEDVLAELGPGEATGELALVDYAPRSATVRAATECRVLRFDRMDLIKLDPALCAQLYHNVGAMLARRLRQTNAFVSELLHRDDASAAADDHAMAAQRKVLHRG